MRQFRAAVAQNDDPIWGPKGAPPLRAVGSVTTTRAERILPLVFFTEIQPVTDAKDFVQGVLIEQGASVVYGDSNTGKTFFATNLALSVAAGITWAGKRVEQGAVIYCVLEGGIGFKNRVSAWKTAQDFMDPNIPFVAIPSTLNLLDPGADLASLIKTAEHVADLLKIPVKLIVIDTLSRAMAGGNENAPEDMGALVQNIDALREATGSHVMFIHHSGKDAAKGARGHSLLRAAIDTEIEVVAEEGSATKTATIVKQREMQKGECFTFSLDIVEIGTNRHGEKVTTCLVKHEVQEKTPGTKTRTRLKGHPADAFDVLTNLLASQGEPGFAGTPSGVVSVPDKWWRDRFFEEKMPGAEYETKKKAFSRASSQLLSMRRVGMAKGRVWLAYETVKIIDHVKSDMPPEDVEHPDDIR